ncbi:MAG: hypothetical protein GC155_07575 [Alphaproteobacteria bacterium]|nr:hypothetical protein [Alphaproteobacteria bacterium]
MRIAIDWKQQARDIAILAGVGVLMAVLSPFGSVAGVPLPLALAYWISLIVWGGVAGEGLAWLLRRFGPPLPLWGFLGILSVLMTLAVFPALALEQAVVLHQPITPGQIPRFLFYIWLIAMIVSFGVVLGFRAFGRRSGLFDPAVAAPAPPAGPSPFLDRLPVRLRASTLYAVQSEDHYLRVHTSGGEELILMRLADAVRELASVEGLQTHRSWWVARDGLADTSRANGKLVLKLKSGIEAPVSRTYLTAVREKGWV